MIAVVDERRVAAEVAIEVAQQVHKFLEQMRLARHKLFGASSEAHLGQGLLFNEVEALADADEPDPEQDEGSALSPAQNGAAARSPGRGKRRPLPPELPRVDILIDVPQDERVCVCGKHMVKIGEEVSEQLNIIPMPHRSLPHHEGMVVTAEYPQKNVRFYGLHARARMGATRRWIGLVTDVWLTEAEYLMYLGFFKNEVGRRLL